MSCPSALTGRVLLTLNCSFCQKATCDVVGCIRSLGSRVGDCQCVSEITRLGVDGVVAVDELL